MISNGKFKPDILIVDDHLIFRQGLKALLIRQNIANVIGEASNGVEYLELVSHLKPDLVLMDIDMPQMNGLEAIKRSQVLFPDLKIIVFTMFGDEDYYYKMIELGVIEEDSVHGSKAESMNGNASQKTKLKSGGV